MVERLGDQVKLRKIHGIIDNFAAQRPNAFFVQIGANDGRTNDQLHRHIVNNPGWSGLVVEPILEPYEELVKTYANRPNITPVRKAIFDVEGDGTMYKVAESDTEAERHSLLSSFNKELLLSKCWMTDIDSAPQVTTEAVDCVTLPHLLEEHKVEAIDILEIDTEGMDAVVMAQFDLERYMPSLIIFEHDNISADERETTLGRLDDAGYRFITMSIDTFCMSGV